MESSSYSFRNLGGLEHSNRPFSRCPDLGTSQFFRGGGVTTAIDATQVAGASEKEMCLSVYA
jgi:hypothetical protein